MRGPLALALALLAVAAPAASAASFPGQQAVTGPQLVASLNAGLRYWSDLGRAPSCPNGITIYTAQLPAPDVGVHAAGRATLGGCEIWLDSEWIASLTNPSQLCPPITHEVGHLTGLPDGGTGYAVMDAGVLENLPPIAPCLEAFPPPPPVAVAPVASAPAKVVAVHLAPVRLTLRALRAEARDVINRKGVRPVRCKLQSARRGTCAAKFGARSCRGKVYVSMTTSGGISGIEDVSCARR
jgi:hypothetical protein